MVNKNSNPKQLDWTGPNWTDFGQKNSYPGPETGHKFRTKYSVYNEIYMLT